MARTLIREGLQRGGTDPVSGAPPQACAPIQRERSPFEAAPTFLSASLPPLKIISVGIERTPNLLAVSGFSSTLSFTIFTLPAISFEMSSSEGPIMRHGPHHSAQKSTTTGCSDLITSFSKEESLVLAVGMVVPFTRRRPCFMLGYEEDM